MMRTRLTVGSGRSAAAGRAQGVALSFALLILSGCAWNRGTPPAPVPAAASRAFAEARRLDRSGDRAAAVSKIDEALVSAPGWVAPQRLRDDWRRDDLVVVEAVTEYRRLLHADPGNVGALYLCGRLEGQAGRVRFERALIAAPRHPWSLHGSAWTAFLRGDLGMALARGRRAFNEARESSELQVFATALARYLRADDNVPDARRILEQALSSTDLADHDRLALAVALAQAEFDTEDEEVQRRGKQRALTLLGEENLSALQVRDVFGVLTSLRHVMLVDRDEVILALGRQSAPLRDSLVAQLMFRESASPLAFQLYMDAQRMPASSQRTPDVLWLRRRRFALGRAEAALEGWLAELPQVVLDAAGLPHSERLAAMVSASRDYALAPNAVSARQLGAAMLAAGWFTEARSWALTLPTGMGDYARELEIRARAGQYAVDRIGALVIEIERGAAHLDHLAAATAIGGADAAPATEAHAQADVSAYSSEAVQGLDGLLRAIDVELAQLTPWLPAWQPQDFSLADSPRVGYGWIASIVHPGPTFSAQDERLGRGQEGARVPGLAAALDALGRFGVFGDALGQQGPDGTLLQRLHLEPGAGQLLGRDWSGSIVWCEGADLPSRAGRQGAVIAGAAVHEGFWIDVQAVREELTRWRRLRDRFDGADELARLTAALAVQGLDVGAGAGDAREEFDRARIDVAQGAAARLRLAVMQDLGRAAAHSDSKASLSGAPQLIAPALDDLLHITAVHEQAHLCDRADFYPIGEHLGAALLFLWKCGLSPEGVARRLEYRAQLTAVCAVRDPRLPMVELLAAAENGGAGVTPHAAAYVELLADFLREWDRALEREPERWTHIDPNRTLLHQVHRLQPEQIRELALVVAQNEGLVRR